MHMDSQETERSTFTDNIALQDAQDKVDVKS